MLAAGLARTRSVLIQEKGWGFFSLGLIRFFKKYEFQ